MSSCDRLQSDTSIPEGFCIVSPNEKYYLKIQEEGNLVLYKENVEFWSSETKGLGIGPYLLRMHNDGNLCLYGLNDTVIWSSKTRNVGNSPYQVKMQDDGNLCVYETSGKCIWATNTCEK